MNQVWGCRKCPAIGQGDISPSKAGCPSGGTHMWDPLAEVGSKSFSCRVCGTHVSAKTTPRGICYKSNKPGKSHEWS